MGIWELICICGVVDSKDGLKWLMIWLGGYAYVLFVIICLAVSSYGLLWVIGLSALALAPFILKDLKETHDFNKKVKELDAYGRKAGWFE
jgi:hypothetical protein